MSAPYRDNAALTLAELAALAESTRPEASRCRDALRQAQRIAGMHLTAAKETAGCFVVALMVAAGCAAFRSLDRAAVVGIAAFVVLLVLVAELVRLRWWFARLSAARADYAKAYRAWHVATARADALRSQSPNGGCGRCGCEDCEADPLGFFPPYARSTR
jgi:hypothetical protein